MSNVLLNPLQRQHLIHDTKVSIEAKARECKEAKGLHDS